MTSDPNNAKGYFLFSLDTELAWGWFDHPELKEFSTRGQRERRNIERLLNLLDEFNIKATWAIVGHLLYERCENCLFCPIMDWRDRYAVFESIYGADNPLWYGADIIENILHRKTVHEIAIHGYTHKIFDEKNMTREEGLIEIQESLKIFARKHILPKTIVFPRNKIGYLDLFSKYGFLCYRGEELMPKVFSLPLIGRMFRRYYSYLSAFYVPVVYDCGLDPSGLVNLPSSRWFLGFNRKLEWILDKLNLHTLLIRNLVKGVEKAATEKRIIHIWAHPCEFQTEKDFEKLRYLFASVSTQVDKGLLESVAMADLARKVHQIE